MITDWMKKTRVEWNGKWYPKTGPLPVAIGTHGELLVARDWLGRTFQLGSRVMYCIGAGRGQMMAYGVVVDMAIANQHNPEWGEIEVKVLTERTSGKWDNEARTRPAWVNPMNITVPVKLGHQIPLGG